MSAAQEAAHRAASDREAVVWVDREDRVLGVLPRAELRQRGLIGRCTFILVFNAAGELCVHRRTLSKALYPGYWDMAAGGMVAPGEGYAESAARELDEELGIAGVPLHAHGTFFYEEPGNRLWGGVFSVRWDGPLRLQPEEVLEARFLAPAAVRDLARREPCCPDSLQALQRVLECRIPG